MKVHRDINQLPLFQRAVITIGTFDGVHSGHRKIIDQLRTEAQQVEGESVIITFHPHPRSVLRAGQSAVSLINTIEEKIELLEKSGIDHLVIVPFTEEFSKLSATDYVEKFLVDRFHPHTVIIGYDHHFGAGRTGDFKLLEQYRDKGYFRLKEIPELLLNENSVSSTAIRRSIAEGKIELANQLLGYDFFFEGKVIHGNKLGRTLGYPTANIEVLNPDKLIPSNGIYAVEAMLDRQHTMLKGMMSIGIRPTIGGTTRVIEVNLFDFKKEIYHSILRVYVKHYLREELKFEGLEALTRQIAQDEINARRLMGL